MKRIQGAFFLAMTNRSLTCAGSDIRMSSQTEMFIKQRGSHDELTKSSHEEHEAKLAVAESDAYVCVSVFPTLAGPTPTNISRNSEPLTVMKGTLASPAVALARRVFPVPGGPVKMAPYTHNTQLLPHNTHTETQ